jgi:hypothetical protein
MHVSNHYAYCIDPHSWIHCIIDLSHFTTEVNSAVSLSSHNAQKIAANMLMKTAFLPTIRLRKCKIIESMLRFFLKYLSVIAMYLEHANSLSIFAEEMSALSLVAASQAT